MKRAGLTGKGQTISMHAGAWLLVFSLPYLLRFAQQIETSSTAADEHNFYLSLITNVSWMAIFYTNALVLIPGLAYQKRWGTYCLVLLFLLSWMIVQTGLLFQYFYGLPRFDPGINLLFVLFVFGLMIASSTAYRLIHDRIQLERKAKERETEHLRTELAFLRSQISPHFVFNVLNNMVALARLRPGDLEPSLIKLSSLLRYMLYETKEEKVLLSKEVEYLESYIDLQSQRFGSVQINACLELPDHPYWIEPMLLVPFVENAFKHGTGLMNEGCIFVSLKAQEKILAFCVRNRYSRDLAQTKDPSSGIGLKNVRRRLSLLYPGQHTLLIHPEDDSFAVTLTINFD